MVFVGFAGSFVCRFGGCIVFIFAGFGYKIQMAVRMVALFLAICRYCHCMGLSFEREKHFCRQ